MIILFSNANTKYVKMLGFFFVLLFFVFCFLGFFCVFCCCFFLGGGVASVYIKHSEILCIIRLDSFLKDFSVKYVPYKERHM